MTESAPLDRPVCPVCDGAGRLSFSWQRADRSIGTTFKGCTACPAGHEFDETVKRDLVVLLKKFRSKHP